MVVYSKGNLQTQSQPADDSVKKPSGWNELLLNCHQKGVVLLSQKALLATVDIGLPKLYNGRMTITHLGYSLYQEGKSLTTVCEQNQWAVKSRHLPVMLLFA